MPTRTVIDRVSATPEPDPDLAPLTDAVMISSGDDALDAAAPQFVRTFRLHAPVAHAWLTITALGVYDARLNDQPVATDVLSPGWTDYRHRLTYDRHDVTKLLVAGENRIAVTVGNGWYRGRLGRPARRDLYGQRIGVIAELSIRTADGDQMIVSTDETWSSTPTGIRANDLYDGCVIDMRPSAVDTPPVAAQVIPFDRSVLRPRRWPAVRVTERIAATHITHDAQGAMIVDFGQNLVGWAVLNIGQPHDGQVVEVSYAEIVIDGQLQTAPLRDARSIDEYQLADGQSSTLRPQFTFHGFRYARIAGLGPDQLNDVEAEVVGSDLRRTGWLETSDPLLNRLHENTVWSLRGNFVSLPTDCPQRDERLGWTADIQLFAPTATFLYDVDALLQSWLEDLYAGQLPDGSVPVVIPDIYRRGSVATAGWGDAVVLVPWELYQHTGDIRVLARAFEPMRRWLDRVRRDTGPDLIWSGGHQYGDWLDPAAPPEDPAAALTDRDLVATAYFYRSTTIAAEVAGLLDKPAEYRMLDGLARGIREAFRATFVTARGRVMSESQTAYALAIDFGLLDGPETAYAGARLADLVRRSGFTIGTGFLGTPVILDALTSTGHGRVAWRLLTQIECPSWLYPVTQGATTVWERWDSQLPDGRLNPGEMTSFNHYAFGAVAAWMHKNLGGLTRLEPGWARYRVAPSTQTGLTYARTRHLSPAGPIDVRWQRHDGTFELDIEVPPGTVAEVVMPDGSLAEAGPGQHRYTAETVPHIEPTVANTRAAMDDPQLWAQVVGAVQQLRPHWTAADVAGAAWPYLSRPLPDLARCVGLSIPTPAEDKLHAALQQLVSGRTGAGPP
ncbi:family 78 glycoside hydrolase catalytic domain [Mycolicibacterium sp. P9-22]|uniref:family 78 glycoside hydrolase catalytic domain n=1 Tax=Mycolicibacterium sp. P9-22 TaxID=2024613 RepID=UPI0011EE58A0|nr:family 78 glycoside hydrolase catalytic domain [Mycolicibacterium sp. P9-22]KAA0120605.1 alpha-L-rhamnosidase [Mycolicibacterium sp. P9-22]